MEDNTFTGMLFLLAMGLFVANLIQAGQKTWNSNVTDGGVFKIYEATYRCQKLNELKYDK